MYVPNNKTKNNNNNNINHTSAGGSSSEGASSSGYIPELMPVLDTMATQSWYPPPNRPAYNYVVDTPPSNSREMRNKAEKQRRDRLNSFISELASLVPIISKSPKKLDKTSILRLTATHLRLYQTLTHSSSLPHMDIPQQVGQNVLEQLVCDELGGFLLILTSTGKIVFVSHTVESLLGHLQTDLLGQSLFNIVAGEDHDRLRLYLQCEGDMEQQWRKYFGLNIKRAGPRSETPVYESVRMMGVHRQGSNGHASPASTSSSVSSTASSLVNDIMIFFVKVTRPETFVDRMIETAKEEYMTRHLIDGKIINCDQRISLIAGYMTEEVTGKSAFSYMHRDDVRWVMIALRQMYDRGESKGNSCYRLKSRNGQFIYLRTFGFLEIDNQGTVESFICVNSLVPEDEGQYLINEMKKKYTTMLPLSDKNKDAYNGNSFLPTQNDVLASSSDVVEDPLRVQEAVAYLLRNLPSPDCSEEEHHSPTPSSPTRAGVVEVEDSKDNVLKRAETIKQESKLTELMPSIKSEPHCNVRLKTALKRQPSNDSSSSSSTSSTTVKRPKICVTPPTTTKEVSPMHRPPPKTCGQGGSTIVVPKAEPILYPQHDTRRNI